MKKLSTVITAFLICAAVFASTTQFDQTRTESIEPHVHCLEAQVCDGGMCQCEEEFGVAGQVLVANKNPFVRWACTVCGQKVSRHKSQGRPAPGRCPRKKNGAGHSWVRD